MMHTGPRLLPSIGYHKKKPIPVFPFFPAPAIMNFQSALFQKVILSCMKTLLLIKNQNWEKFVRNQQKPTSIKLYNSPP